MGRPTGFECAEQGGVERVTLSDRSIVQAKRNHRNRIVEITATGDRRWTATFGADGILSSLRGPSVPQIEIQRSHKGTAAIRIIDSLKTTIAAERGGNSWMSYCAAQASRGFTEPMNRRIPGMHRVKQAVASDGRSLRIYGPAGGIRILSSTNAFDVKTVEFLRQ
jgi:hypothetical protein